MSDSFVSFEGSGLTQRLPSVLLVLGMVVGCGDGENPSAVSAPAPATEFAVEVDPMAIRPFVVQVPDAVIGVEDLIVVATDDAVLVLHAQHGGNDHHGLATLATVCPRVVQGNDICLARDEGLAPS